MFSTDLCQKKKKCGRPCTNVKTTRMARRKNQNDDERGDLIQTGDLIICNPWYYYQTEWILLNAKFKEYVCLIFQSLFSLYIFS